MACNSTVVWEYDLVCSRGNTSIIYDVHSTARLGFDRNAFDDLICPSHQCFASSPSFHVTMGLGGGAIFISKNPTIIRRGIGIRSVGKYTSWRITGNCNSAAIVTTATLLTVVLLN